MLGKYSQSPYSQLLLFRFAVKHDDFSQGVLPIKDEIRDSVYWNHGNPILQDIERFVS